MPLVVEDGSGVVGANSYVSLQNVRDYAALRGLTVPSDDAVLTPLVINAADFLETLRREYKGHKTNDTQAMQWPRKCVFVDNACDALADTLIPTELKNTQCQLAFDGILNDLMPVGEGRQTILEKVDVLEVHYSDQGLATLQPIFTKARAMLKELLINQGAFALRSVRI